MDTGEPLTLNLTIRGAKATVIVTAQTMLEWKVEPNAQDLQRCRERAIGMAEAELTKRGAKSGEAWVVSVHGESVSAVRA